MVPGRSVDESQIRVIRLSAITLQLTLVSRGGRDSRGQPCKVVVD